MRVPASTCHILLDLHGILLKHDWYILDNLSLVLDVSVVEIIVLKI